MAQLAQHAQLQNLIRASVAPEKRLPGQAVAGHRTFLLLLALVGALGIAPFVIAWAAAGLIQ